MGTVLASNEKARRAWLSERARDPVKGLRAMSDEVLERRIMAAAQMFPGHIIRETRPV